FSAACSTAASSWPRCGGRNHVITRKIHYAWIVAGVTFCALLIGAGVRAVPGILVVPLENEFGWSRATISLGVGINIFIYGMMAPFAAALMDRFGIRRTMVAALSMIGLGVVLTMFMKQSWQFVLLWGLFVGVGIGFTTNVVSAIVASRW